MTMSCVMVSVNPFSMRCISAAVCFVKFYSLNFFSTNVVDSELACSDPIFRGLHNRAGGWSAAYLSVLGTMGR